MKRNAPLHRKQAIHQTRRTRARTGGPPSRTPMLFSKNLHDDLALSRTRVELEQRDLLPRAQ